MSSITIPQFYIAVKLHSDGGSKSVSRVDKDTANALRLASEQYLLTKLRPTLTGLTSIKLQFGSISFDPPKRDQLSDFDLYWEGDVTVKFDTSLDNDKNFPTKSSVFQLILSTLGSKEYLLDVVHQVNPTSSSPLALAMEIQAKLLKRPTAGGTVQAPAFYIALVSKSQTVLDPSATERQSFIDLVHSMAHKKLSKTFPNSFEYLEINIVKLEFQQGIPDDRFNIYLELSAVAKFSYDTPDAMDFFQVLTKSMNANMLNDLNALGDCCFCQITNMVMRLCVVIEVPALIDTPDDGNADGDRLIVKVYLHFFIALVLVIVKRMPSQTKCAAFHHVIQDFFTSVLATAYPSRFVSLSLPDPQTRMDAGMPSARYNVLHEYNAVLEFYDGGVPNEHELLTKFVQCNVLALTQRLLQSTDPWCKFREVTLGKVAEKPVSDETYNGKIDIVAMHKTMIPPQKSLTKSPEKKRIKPCVVNKESEQKLEIPAMEEQPEYVIVSTSDVFMSFSLPEDADDPSPADYDQLANMTSKYYRKHLRHFFRDTFVDIQVTVRKTKRRCDIPNSNYSHYVEWNIEAKFRPHASVSSKVPTDHALCRSLISALYQDYLVDYVCRRLKTTPFRHTMRVYSEQVVVDTKAPLRVSSKMK
jgi:hypothetical protein